MNALYHARAVRIANDAADQMNRWPCGFRLGGEGAHLQETLSGFGNERRAVRQSSWCVALCLGFRALPESGGVIMTILAQRHRNEQKQNSAGCSARRHCRDKKTAAMEVPDKDGQTERHECQYDRMADRRWYRADPPRRCCRNAWRRGQARCRGLRQRKGTDQEVIAAVSRDAEDDVDRSNSSQAGKRCFVDAIRPRLGVDRIIVSDRNRHLRINDGFVRAETIKI